MESKNIILILIVIIVILAVVIGFAMFNPMHAKEPTKIKITSDKEQYEGGEISIQLTDLNKTPLSKEDVNITITNSKGKVVFDDIVKTNSKGKAKSDLDLKKGKYKVTVSYGGNENYTGNNTTQKLTIKEEEKIVEEPVIEQSAESSSSSNNNEIYYDAEMGIYYDSNHVIVDPDGQHQHGVGGSYDAARDAQDRWNRGEPVMI